MIEKKTNRTFLLSFFAILLLIFNVFVAVPVKGWVYPDGSEDTKFELYGPHVAGILCKLYVDEQAEWTAMDNDELDFEDWPLTAAWVEAWQDDPRFQLKNYGGEAGYFILDMNHYGDLLLPNGDPNPTIDAEMGINVMTILSFRQALACLVNRSYIVNDITQGFGLPMWTPVPVYMTTYVHPDIRHGGALEDLTYGGYEGDVALAEQYLNDDGFLYLPGEYPWRFYDRDQNGHYDAGEEFSLIFYARSDSLERFAFANSYVLKLTSAPINIQVDYRPRGRSECSARVFGAKEFHLYTGGWTHIGPDPDYLYDLHHSTMYWHPGNPPNYGDGYDALLDQYAEDIKFATTTPDDITATMNFQERFAELVWNVPLWCTSGVKAYRRVPVEEPGPAEWKDVVNQVGFGMNSWWTFLNLMKECEFYPPIYVNYGISIPTIESLNPIYAGWYWDWEVLGQIYGSLGRRDPYDLGILTPQSLDNWIIDVWTDPTTLEQKSKVIITLRPDLYWQDGTPITLADIKYTFKECVDALLAKGLPPPWWYATSQNVVDFYQIDPLNMKILLDVTSVWAVSWVLSTPIIPKHIWKPIIDASSPADPIVTGFQPDPNCIGSGPFRFVDYIPYDRVVLDANTPGSVVNGITSPGYWQYCPIHVKVHADDYRVRFDPGYPKIWKLVNITVMLHNLWLNQCNSGFLDGTKYVYVDGELIEAEPVILYSCEPAYEYYALNLTKCMHTVKVAFHVESPSMLDDIHPNPWLCQWINVTLPVWITYSADICGATYQGAVTAPDCKVDLKDLAMCAAAYGSYPDHQRWDSLADINQDYVVDIIDYNIIARHYTGLQDVAITNVTISRNFVYQGYGVKINVTVENQGTSQQNVSLSIRFNESDVKTGSVLLDPGASALVKYDVIPRAFLFEEISRTSVPPGNIGPETDFTVNGTTTYLRARTQYLGGVAMYGGVIDLYYNNGTLIRHEDVYPYPSSPVITAANYSSGLYVMGTVRGELCFMDEKGEFGEMPIGETYVRNLTLNATHVEVTLKDEVVVLKRHIMDFRLPKGNYTISAYAEPVLGEVELEDNVFIDSSIVVRFSGDINSDNKCDGKDVARISKAYNTKPGDLLWNIDADINGDNKVDGKDVAVVSKYYDQPDP
jgi:ABC-type transport system substrate-binding protein